MLNLNNFFYLTFLIKHNLNHISLNLLFLNKFHSLVIEKVLKRANNRKTKFIKNNQNSSKDGSKLIKN